MNATDREALKTEVQQVILALDTIASMPIVSGGYGFGDGRKRVGINFSLRACEIAAEITGRDRFFAKMLNHKFRTDAAELMFERARVQVAA